MTERLRDIIGSKGEKLTLTLNCLYFTRQKKICYGVCIENSWLMDILGCPKVCRQTIPLHSSSQLYLFLLPFLQSQLSLQTIGTPHVMGTPAQHHFHLSKGSAMS